MGRPGGGQGCVDDSRGRTPSDPRWWTFLQSASDSNVHNLKNAPERGCHPRSDVMGGRGQSLALGQAGGEAVGPVCPSSWGHWKVGSGRHPCPPAARVRCWACGTW